VTCVVLPLVGLAVVAGLRPGLEPARRFALALAVVGLLLVLAVEFVALRGDVGRMNTVFKIYLQVWVLWGLAASLAVVSLVQGLPRGPDGPRRWWLAGLVVLLVPALAYPAVAVPARLGDRFQGETAVTLDGRAFLDGAVYHDRADLVLAHDRRAIDWLLDTVEGTPVIVEGHTPEYRWGGRYSVHTGLPTIVGWSWHQRQQRAILADTGVERRIRDVELIYTSTEPREVLARLRAYGARYIVVGELERAYYPAAGLDKFARMAEQGLLEEAYRGGPVIIYRVRAPEATSR
jgi:uncharacterized membrane protein